MKLDAEILKAYQERWQAVAEMENAQRQRTSLTERWQKLNALFRMAAALDLFPTTTDREAEIGVYERWSRLRAKYVAQQQERVK